MWRYNLDNNTWTFLTGSKKANDVSNYVEPYPGGLIDYAMCVYAGGIYIFGGSGFNDTIFGIA